ncbi:MAG: PH domain-containing protein [Muribaculaceae bacterium]|nr:PH domain-containing protein [Muribaculaceae bacterium]
MEFEGTKYASRWDASTWLLLLLMVLVCIWPVFLDGDWVGPLIVAVGLVASFVGLFLGTYYRIDGDKLVVYQFFTPTALPIDKISEIRPTKTILASPATSLTHRIAIKFSDRKVLKSSAPLVISPVRKREFIAQLTNINPDIKVEE